MSIALHDSPETGDRSHTDQNQTHRDQFADVEELSRALDTCQWQLIAALQQKVDLLRRCSILNEKVSSLEVALEKANQFAHCDELTGLPNRRLLLDRFMQAAALADRHRVALALLFFNVNDFKRVNDKLGHDAGDKLLQQMATRLSSAIRGSDTACRCGGDEFAVLLTEIDHLNNVVTALQKIRTELALPYLIDRHSIRLTVSDGLAIYPRDAQRFTDLMLLADRSMFSKKSGYRLRSGGAPASSIKELCISR
jgi:diguanylate cyclase (GGDEF)-like protein